MTGQRWDVRLTAAAEKDFDDALWASIQSFGAAQARAYEALILDALADLDSGPNAPRSIARDNVAPGYRSLHITRRGRNGRHILLYRTGGPGMIEVVRILHDSMDIAPPPSSVTSPHPPLLSRKNARSISAASFSRIPP